MPLNLHSEVMDDVVLIRCSGRIAFGAEVEALQSEVDKHTKIAGTNIYCLKQVVLNLSGTDYIDSSGLGTLVRLHGTLRAAGGGLKLCQLSPTVLKTIQITNLDLLFPFYDSEADAIDSFASQTHAPRQHFGPLKSRIVCVDPSSDLLAGLSALLTNSGYEAFTTRFAGEAATLVRATGPKLVICGPGIMKLPTGPALIEKFRQSGAKILQLPSDFHTSEAGQAGQDLIVQVQSLIAS